MADLLWPGAERAGGLLSDAAVLDAMVRVEQAWLDQLARARIAPARTDLARLIEPGDAELLAAGAESAGTPVVGLVRLLRERLGDDPAAPWVHCGLTSQDVLDTALVLALRAALDRILDELRGQVVALAGLARTHRDTPLVGRTLTQHAVPISFGLKITGWLGGVLDAAAAVRSVREPLPAQIGGAAGTLAAATELAALAGSGEPVATALDLKRATADALGLVDAPPWHTTRTAITRAGDALVGCTDAWGHLAADIATLARPEIGELAEPAAPGRGGSSTMPQKTNPVLSVLLRRAALAAPPLAATLHTAAALAVDERPDGAWHAEWATVRTLAGRTVVAGSQATELLTGLRVDAGRMHANLDAAAGVYAERDALQPPGGAAGRGRPARTDDRDRVRYLGATGVLVDAGLDRARRFLEDSR